MRYLIVHKEDGIYLGECLGLGFCSKVDPVGQDTACTFESIEDCVDYINSWESVKKGEQSIKDYTFVPVTPSEGNFATIQDCVAAGLEGWDPNR